jgi:indole-3-glycerol phosphate synthase
MTFFLQKIYALTQARVAEAKKVVPAAGLKETALFARKPQDVREAFTGGGYNIIAEVKFSSPSEGVIRPDGDSVMVAASYLQARATMLSVLTEPQYFKGDLRYLSAIRAAYPAALLLRKDFIVDPYQLLEARAHGADAVLLIAAMTEAALTKDLFHEAVSLGLTPLVEVHDAAELEAMLDFGADFIGVNNRNLKTLKIDLETGRQLITKKPKGDIFICESGLSTAEDVRDMRALGYDGFLMGTHFMRHTDPGHALSELMEALSCV